MVFIDFCFLFSDKNERIDVSECKGTNYILKNIQKISHSLGYNYIND